MDSPMSQTKWDDTSMWQAVFFAARDAMFIINLQGEYQTANPAATRLTGYTVDEFRGMTVDDLLMPGSGLPAEERERIWREGRTVEVDLRHKDGHPVPVELSIAPILNASEALVLGIAHDISERKKAGEFLRESEERFRQLAENIDAVFYMSDPQKSKMLYVSPAYEKIWRRTCQSLYDDSRSFVDAIHPDDRPAVLDSFEKQSRGEPIEVEYRVVRPDGDIRYILSRAFPVYDSDGKFYRIAGIVQDISDRKQTEKTIQESEERFRILTSESPVGMFLDDAEGNAIYINDRCAELVGVPMEQALNLDWVPYIHPDDRERVTSEWFSAIQNKETFHQDYRWVHPDGEVVWTVGKVVPVKRPDGSVINFIGTLEDITEQKKAEAAIKQYAMESAALESISKSVSASLELEDVIDRAIAETGRVLQPDMALLFLREGKNLVLRGEYHPKGGIHHAETPLHRVGQCLCGIAAQSAEPVFSTDVRADLRCTWVECKKAGIKLFSALPLTIGNEVLGVLGLASKEMRDFSERESFLEAFADTVATGIQNALLHREIQQHVAELENRVEERTKELAERAEEMETLNQAMLAMLEDLQAANQRYERVNDKLKKVNAELETFTHSVSHDLKAPLRGIDGYSRLLLEDYADQLDDQGQQFLHTIRKATMQMNQLIEDLLAYSRLERRVTQSVQINLREMTTMILHEFDDEIQLAGINVENNIPDWQVSGDPTGLEMAFRNYISNAIKFTRTSPHPEVKITGQKTENGCIIAVTDNGVGFDMKFHDRIFGIFQRLHRPEDYPGTGVGLAIVHKAMERLGGRAWAESLSGQGATFFLEIPEEAHDTPLS